MSAGYEIHLSSPGGGGGPPPPPGGQDRFTPKYLVGNVPAGDSNVPYATGGFIYIPDAGDCVGIQTALAQASGPGDVAIRPGTFVNLTGAALQVPAGIRVQGSGATTIVQGAGSGDQGVFVLGQNSQLHDLNVTVAASPGSVTSLAAIRSIGALAIENVQVSFATDPAGVLRYGISFEPSGIAPLGGEITSVVSVQVSTTSTTGIADPTVCYFLAAVQQSQSFVSARDTLAFGGDIGVLNDGIFISEVFFAVEWSQYGVFVTPSGGTFRAFEGFIASTAVPAANPIGVYAQGGGGHLLSGMTVQMSTAGSRGVVFDNPAGGGTGGITLLDCFVVADLEGIRLGSATFGIGSSTVTDCNVGAGAVAIVLGPNSDTTVIDGCNINIGNAFAAPVAGVDSEASRSLIVNNIVNVQDNPPVGTGIGIRSAGSRCTVSHNTANVQGAEGIRIEGERTTSVGNIVEMNFSGSPTIICMHFVGSALRSTCGDNNCTNGNPYTRPCIVIDAGQMSCGDNTTFNQPLPDNAPSPGIELNGVNTTCLGNVCEGAAPGGIPVQDNGAGNEVAHNIAA